MSPANYSFAVDLLSRPGVIIIDCWIALGIQLGLNPLQRPTIFIYKPGPASIANRLQIASTLAMEAWGVRQFGHRNFRPEYLYSIWAAPGGPYEAFLQEAWRDWRCLDRLLDQDDGYGPSMTSSSSTEDANLV